MDNLKKKKKKIKVLLIINFIFQIQSIVKLCRLLSASSVFINTNGLIVVTGST